MDGISLCILWGELCSIHLKDLKASKASQAVQ